SRRQAGSSKSQDGSEHRKRRAMRGRGKGDQKKQADPFAATEIRLMIDKQIERKHADVGENVSEKRARQERQGRAERQPRDTRDPVPRTRGKPLHPKYERYDPEGASGLKKKGGQERQPPARVQKHPEPRRAARHEISFVPGGQITAGVV